MQNALVQQNEHIDLFTRCVFANAYIVAQTSQLLTRKQVPVCLQFFKKSGSTINPMVARKNLLRKQSKSCLQALERVYPSNGPSGNAAKHWCG